MGIASLLPLVGPACRSASVDEFKGCTVAVDASCWLHKALFGCAAAFAQGKKTDMYVTYCLKWMQMLLDKSIRVVLVFDGASLPAKSETNAARRQRRMEMKEKAARYARLGKMAQAVQCYQRATEITHDMVVNVIRACVGHLPNVHWLVAPYEADAQLCYLDRAGLVDLVISEDSDLIAFGCSRVLFKMDSAGRGQLYERQYLHKALNTAEDRFDFVKFRRICILSGCDYLASLPGIGLKRSIKFFNQVSCADPNKFLRYVPKVLRMADVVVTRDYVQRFVEAENTFLHQLVFDPISCRQIPLHPYPEGLQSCHFPYAGGLSADEDVALSLASGNMNPYDMQPLPNPVHPEPREQRKSRRISNDKATTGVSERLTVSPADVSLSVEVYDSYVSDPSQADGSDNVEVELRSSYFETALSQPYNPFKALMSENDGGTTSPCCSGLAGQQMAVNVRYSDPIPSKRSKKTETIAQRCGLYKYFTRQSCHM